jgi:hypothetical protein
MPGGAGGGSGRVGVDQQSAIDRAHTCPAESNW